MNPFDIGKLVAAFATVSLGCLDPLVSDEVERPHLILPAGTELPLLAATPVLRGQVARGDGIDGDLVPLHSGFAHGERIAFWDFGEASVSPIPLYVLVELNEQGNYQTPSGRYAALPSQPPIIDAVPGDPGYSPWWIIVIWPVTERYRGELISSFAAMDEAYRQGLVSASITLPRARNCPVVLPEARLQASPHDPRATLEPEEVLYKGYLTHYFSFGSQGLTALTVPAEPVYVLRREGGEPLSEPLRGVDLTADGDRYDTNDLFTVGPADDDYSGMATLYDAVVSDEELIDRSRDDAESALMDAGQLFQGDAPDPRHLVALYPLGITVNRPLWEPED